RCRFAYPKLISENHATAGRAGEHEVGTPWKSRGWINLEPAPHHLVLVIGDAKFYFGHAAEWIGARGAKGHGIHKTTGFYGDVLKCRVVGAAMCDATDAQDFTAGKISGRVSSWHRGDR